ncbi:Ig-like domain-containing protein, partial [Tenacibaculum amylolyticum]|uniref:Ig-like domain-containing protein n=1 Tax=Tenacibaculum amylolyticum TaxID=104269 RepID=UPI0038B4FF55
GADDVLTVVEGQNASVNVLANDDFEPGTNTSITQTGGTAAGTVNIDPLTGEVTYTPSAGEEGSDVTIVIEVCNTAVTPQVCVTETITVTVQVDTDGDGTPDVTDTDDDNDGNPDVTDPNPLVATGADDVLVVGEGQTASVNVLANDDFEPGANTSITQTGGTAAGTVSIDPLTGEVTYTPAAGEQGGTVTIVLEVCNTAVTPQVCVTETITVTVQTDTDGDGIPDITDTDDDNDGNPDVTDPNPLVATGADDVLTVVEGQTASVNVLANDDFEPGANTSITQTGGTAGGTVSIDPLTGEVTYTAAAGEEGSDVTIVLEVCNTAVTPQVCVTETIIVTVQVDTDGDGTPDVTDTDDDNDG